MEVIINFIHTQHIPQLQIDFTRKKKQGQRKMEKDFFMESEIKNYFKVWILAFISLNYCYFIPSKITKGKFRFISVLPVIILFIILPLNLTTISLGGTTDFFLAWLCNFKLLLFSFDKGPLSSHQSISLSHFILIACLPIKIKQENSPKSSTNQIRPKSPLNFALKGLGIALLTALYQHSQNIHPKIMFVYYCCYLYLSLELLLVMIAGLVRTTLGLELEPQFDEPYLSTSLQDFWGHRWNLMVPNILRPTVYEPVRSIATHILGRKWALLPAVLAAFLTSGLMHELIFFYLGRLSPTWEVTSFFLLQGVCVVLEILVKKMLKDRWRLHPLISGLLTIGFVMVTTYWLFFPPTARFNMVVRSSIEVSIFVQFIKDIGRDLLFAM